MAHEAIPQKEGFFERFQRGLTQGVRSDEAAITSQRLGNEQKRLANALEQLKVIALTDPNNKTANAQATEIFKKAGLPVQEGADFSQFLDKFRAAGQVGPTRETVLDRPTPAAGTTVKTTTRGGEEITRKAPPSQTESQFTAELAKKVAAGTATEQETKVLGILQGPTSQVTLNLTEAGKTAQEDAQIALTFQKQADELNAASPDSPSRFTVKTTSKGQRFLESEPKKAIAEGTANTIVQRENLLRLADDIVDLYDPKFVGPIQGFILGKFRAKTGIGLTAKEASFRTKVAKSIKVAYTDSGKQLSDKELERLIDFLPTVNKVDLKFEAEMVEFVDEVETSLANAKAISTAGGRVDIPDNKRRRTSELVRERFNRQRLGERPTVTETIGVPDRLSEVDKRIAELEAIRNQ
ncbi:MAG TPA: hypothetical protein ENI23_08385 [bacterium]|nr:hypothetical protein [bacterium]